jgi:hypothetical protein
MTSRGRHGSASNGCTSWLRCRGQSGRSRTATSPNSWPCSPRCRTFTDTSVESPQARFRPSRRYLPAAVVDAVRQLAELNEWAILSVASDPDALLPTGRVPSDLLRGAWDPNEGTFSFGDR